MSRRIVGRVIYLIRLCILMQKQGKAKTVSLTGYSYITVKKSMHSGRPTIKNTRITVDDILGSLSSGWSEEEVAEQYNIPKKAVVEAVRFAYSILKTVSVFA